MNAMEITPSLHQMTIDCQHIRALMQLVQCIKRYLLLLMKSTLFASMIGCKEYDYLYDYKKAFGEFVSSLQK